MEKFKKFSNVFIEKKGKYTNYFIRTKLYKSFFEERIFKKGNEIFKEVDPSRSKLFASIAKGISQIGFKNDSSVLYLGASHGYTVSFLADVVEDGLIYALDFAPRVIRDLVFLCEDRENIAPLMDDANHPENYKDKVPKVDVVFMDIAQRNQVEIFIKNCDMFLKEGGFGVLALKARSVDVTKKPSDIFKITRAELEQVMTVVDFKELDPFEKDHALFVCKRRSSEKIDFESIKPVKVNFATDKRRDSNFKRKEFKPRRNNNSNKSSGQRRRY